MNKPKKILIVEDESIVAFNLQSRLEEMGYEVSAIADSGKAAIDFARITKPELVLMDIRLKGNIDGIEAASQIRQQFQIPVIYLTAYADRETLERAKISEPYGYLIKPFESRELSSAIEIAIYKHGMEQKIAEKERWLSTTLRSIGDGVITTDEKGIVNFLNAVAEKLTGWKCQEAVGKKVTEIFNIIDEKNRLPAQNAAAIALAEGKIVNLENSPILIHKNYLETPIENSAAPIQDEAGNIKGVVIVFHDITERKQAEVALQKLNEELEIKVQERTQELHKTVERLETEIADRQRAEAALRQSQMQLQAILDNSPTVIYLYDLENKYLLINQQFEKLFGITKEKIIGQSVYECWPPEIADVFAANNQQVIAGKKPVETEEIAPHQDGLHTYISMKFPLYDANGEPYAVCGISTDITDRKLAEEAFKNSESRLRMALNAAEMGNWDWDMASGKITWSEQTELIYGFELGSFPGTYEAFLSCVHPDDRQYLTQTIDRTFQEKTPYHIEHRIIWSDGSVHWLIGKGDAIYDQNGDPVGMSGVVMDITDRKLAEEALRDSEFKLRTIIENSEDAISLKDTQGRYLLINPAGAKILGCSVSEVLGKRDEELFTPSTGQQIWAADQKVMNSRTTWMYEEEGECDGVRSFWSTKAPYLSPDGELQGIISICRDITESKQIQETMRRQLAAVEAASDGIAILNAAGEYIYSNESHSKIFGYDSASELLGKTWHELYQADEIQRLDQEIFPILIQNGKWQGEAIAKKRDGTTFAEELSLTLVGDGGRELICVCRDITERKRTEKMLLLQDRAIAASNNGIIISDASRPKNPIIYVNPAFERITGYSVAEVLGKNSRFLQGSETDQPGLEILRNTLQKGTDCTVIIRNYRKDGSLFWNELSISPIYDDDGILTHYIGIQTDITQRKQTEEERQAITSRLSALIENLQLGILFKNEYKQIVSINQAFCDLFNIPVVPAALFGADFSEFPEEYQSLFAEPETFIQRYHEILDAQQVVTNEEIKMANGRILERDFVPIFVQQKYTGHLWMYRDITERKKAEIGLQEAKNQLEAVLDAVPGFVSWINADLKYIGVNKYLANTFNLLPENFIDQKVGFMENNSDFSENVRQFFEGENTRSSLVIEQKINHSARSYLVAIQKYQHGKAAVSVGIDITDRKQAESELRKSLKEKEVLLKEIHHRVKNNLQVISSLLKLQSAYIKDQEALSLFTDSYNRVRAMALIHEKLYQSHDLAQINAPEYIRNLVENLHRSYAVDTTAIQFQMNIDQIELDVDTAIPCGLIINELVSNSMKYGFAHKAEGKIKITFVRSRSVKNGIHLSVSDNGVGLPPDFEIEESESLGLQLVCNLTEQLGGNLEIDRANGLRFDITFNQQLKVEK